MVLLITLSLCKFSFFGEHMGPILKVKQTIKFIIKNLIKFNLNIKSKLNLPIKKFELNMCTIKNRIKKRKAQPLYIKIESLLVQFL